MSDKRCRILAGALLLSSLALGCATRPEPIKLPGGRRVEGLLDKDLSVLGVAKRYTFSGNQSNAQHAWIDDNIEIDVPLGTEVIVPAMTTWRLAFGEFYPEVEPGGDNWDTFARPWGAGLVQVWVESIGKPDLQAGTQRATIGVQMHLTDDNLDDPWFGEVKYELIFLGKRRLTRAEVISTVVSFAGPPGPVVSVSNTANQSVSTACPAETELVSATLVTPIGRRMMADASLRIHNGAGGARTYEFRLRRGSCGSGVEVEADGHARTTLASGGYATVSWRNAEDASGDEETYRVCACTSNAAGAGQTVEFVRATLMDF